MQKKLGIISEVINFIMLYSASHIIVLFLCRYLQIPASMTLCFGTMLLMLVMLIARKKFKRLRYFIIPHILAFVILAILPIQIFEKVFLILFTVVLTLSDYVFWMREYGESYDKVHIALVAEFVGFSLLGAYLHMNDVVVVSYRMGVVFLTLYAIRYFIDNICKFFKEGKSVKNVPQKDMMMRGFVPVIVFIVLASMFLLLSNSETVSNAIVSALIWIKDGILKIIVFLLAHFKGEPEEVVQENLGRGGLDELGGARYIFPKWLRYFLYMLEKFFYAVIFVALSYVVIKGVVKWIKVYATRDIINANGLNVKESEEKIESLRKRRHRGLFGRINLTNAEKVRRYYRKKITSFKRHHYYINEAQSPGERCAEIMDTFETDISQLTDVYEQARYSDHSVTNEMVNLAK